MDAVYLDDLEARRDGKRKAKRQSRPGTMAVFDALFS